MARSHRYTQAGGVPHRCCYLGEQSVGRDREGPDFQVGLVDADLFEGVGETGKHAHDGRGVFAVCLHPRGEEHPVRAAAHRGGGGHRRAHPESAGLVAGGGDHSAGSEPTHDDRGRRGGWFLALFDGGEECVGVDVQDEPLRSHRHPYREAAGGRSRRGGFHGGRGAGCGSPVVVAGVVPVRVPEAYPVDCALDGTEGTTNDRSSHRASGLGHRRRSVSGGSCHRAGEIHDAPQRPA